MKSDDDFITGGYMRPSKPICSVLKLLQGPIHEDKKTSDHAFKSCIYTKI